MDFQEILWSTFGDQGVFVSASEGAVDLADQLHVVEESVEGIEVGEAHHVGDAASCSLQRHPMNGSRHVLTTRYVTVFLLK